MTVYSQEGKKLGESDLGGGLLKVPVNKKLLTAVVRMYQTNLRHGTSMVKNRHHVSGSTRKIYRQKGTGRARHGDIKAPLFVGGGVTFGPRPRDWHYRLPKTALRKALVSAVTYVAQNGKLCLVDKLEWETPKTKQGKNLLKKLGMACPLFLLDQPSEAVVRSLRNLAGVKIRDVAVVNAYDVLQCSELVMTQSALTKLTERCAGVMP